MYAKVKEMTKEELYLSILNNIQDGVYYVDIHRKIKHNGRNMVSTDVSAENV